MAHFKVFRIEIEVIYALPIPLRALQLLPSKPYRETRSHKDIDLAFQQPFFHLIPLVEGMGLIGLVKEESLRENGPLTGGIGTEWGSPQTEVVGGEGGTVCSESFYVYLLRSNRFGGGVWTTWVDTGRKRKNNNQNGEYNRVYYYYYEEEEWMMPYHLYNPNRPWTSISLAAELSVEE